jgi:hypothetical protein
MIYVYRCRQSPHTNLSEREIIWAKGGEKRNSDILSTLSLIFFSPSASALSDEPGYRVTVELILRLTVGGNFIRPDERLGNPAIDGA